MDKKAISDIQIELERAYSHFNRELFNSGLKPCMITIQKPAHGSILGWTSVDKIWLSRNQAENRLEVNVCPHIFHEPPDIVYGVLLHEMVHVFNCHRGICDCSHGQYHNRKFRDEAIAVGLAVAKLGYRGWAKTEIAKGGRAEQAIRSLNPKTDVFGYARGLLVRSGGNPPEDNHEPRSKLRRWSCGCQNARVAIKDFQATCKKCGKDFVAME